MRALLIGTVFGVFGALAFLFGGAAAGGGLLGRILTFPVTILDVWVNGSNAVPDEARLNLIAVITQFVVYTLLGFMGVVIRDILAGKHNKPLKNDARKNARAS